MSSRKEEERNEKIIRGLMKLPPNRRCINCNSLGPQYVCTNFWTFVCMTCSGIHREFTHRVKSVSMSKFTSQEVEALQEGGNQRARETFLKDWDPREQRLPDNSNVDKVRDFIKNVYVDKKFFASKASGKPPRDNLSLRNHEDETRRASSYHSYSQSPPYDYQYEERRYGKQAPALTKKPGSDRGMFRFLSTSRLSDHVQEDSFANEIPNARASDYSVSSGGDPFRSDYTHQREPGFSSPSSETSRDNLSEDKGDSDQVTNAQKTGSSGSIAPPNFADKNFIAQTPQQSGKFDGLDLFSAPYAPQSTTSEPSTESKKFDGLDLFNAPQSATSSSPPSVIDLFDFSASSSTLPINPSQPVAPPTSSVDQQFQAFDPSSLDLFANMPLKDKSLDSITQKDEGWATFDMPWHAEPKSSTLVSETSTSHESVGKFDQAPSMPFHQDFSATGSSSLMPNPWHGGVHDIGAPPGVQNNQSWSSFEEINTPFHSIYTKSSEQVPIQDPSVVDPYLAWGTSHQDGPQSHGLDAKSRNPFDFPSDVDLEPSNMFLDMGSLQSSLPNHNMSTSWFPESPDALIFNPSMQIPNIQGQGHVASIGGNPFG